MTDVEMLQDMIADNPFFRSQVKALLEPYCSKCGVVDDFHSKLYCRKIQSLMKEIQKLKKKIAELKKEVAK